MLDIESLKRELIIKYREERAIPCNINLVLCGIKNDEVIVAFDTIEYSFVERFKTNISLKDMCEVLDNTIYEHDYKLAYKELKKFWGDNAIDKSLFKDIFKDFKLDIEENELLINIKDSIFTASFNDDEISYKVNKFYRMNRINENTISFEELDNKFFNKELHDEIDQGVKQLQLNRKESKKELDYKENNLVLSFYTEISKMKNNLEKILIK